MAKSELSLDISARFVGFAVDFEIEGGPSRRLIIPPDQITRKFAENVAESMEARNEKLNALVAEVRNLCVTHIGPAEVRHLVATKLNEILGL